MKPLIHGILFSAIYGIAILMLLLYGYLKKTSELLYIAPFAFLCFIISDWAVRVVNDYASQGGSEQW